MKYLNEYKSFSSYRVFIDWEHGDADLRTQQYYDFKTQDDMDDFLHFIYDIRKFIPNSGYEDQGYFEDGHYQRKREWVEKIDGKYGNRFSDMIPNDNHYRSGAYTPSVDSIHVEIGGVVHNIVWKNAIKTNLINLPKIGDEITVSIGHINGASLGPIVFGGKLDDYFDYDDFDHKEMNVDKGEYDTIRCFVNDCAIDETYRKHRRSECDYVNGREILTKEYMTYHDYVSFTYDILCTFGPTTFNKKIVTQIHGYDPKFESKFHRGLGDLYFV